MMKKRKLREERFAREYVIDLNGTRAAIAAGYSKKGADVAAVRLLGNARVKQLIADLSEKQAAELDFTANKVLNELSKLAFSNMFDYVRVQDGQPYIDFTTVTRAQAAAIQEVTSETYVDHYEGEGNDRKPVEVKRTKFKLSDKRSALELLGKHLKLFADRTEITGADGKPLQIISHVPRPERNAA